MKTLNRCSAYCGLTEAYNRGRIAAFRGQTCDANEFAPGSAQSDSWLDGFTDSLAQVAAEAELAREMIAANVPIHRVEERLDAGEPQPKAVSIAATFKAFITGVLSCFN